MKIISALTFCATMIPACGETPPATPSEKAKPLVLLAGDDLKGWKVIEEMKDHGPVSLKEGVLTLGAGKPMTGIVYAGKPEALPVKDYEVTFEARRTSGSDFFGALTFPVRNLKTCATLVLGGWGGKCVGISSLNYQSADENETTNWIDFENNRWYKIRLEVRENALRGWIDEKIVFDVSTEEKRISMRFGDIELCQPLGLATYLSEGEIKGLQIKPLPPAA
ncbi:MAG: DUF1080 domain-containing protein [Verrucomicrobiales bacterium]